MKCSGFQFIGFYMNGMNRQMSLASLKCFCGGTAFSALQFELRSYDFYKNAEHEFVFVVYFVFFFSQNLWHK